MDGSGAPRNSLCWCLVADISQIRSADSKFKGLSPTSDRERSNDDPGDIITVNYL